MAKTDFGQVEKTDAKQLPDKPIDEVMFTKTIRKRLLKRRTLKLEEGTKQEFCGKERTAEKMPENHPQKTAEKSPNACSVR